MTEAAVRQVEYKGAMGISHIREARTLKDGMTDGDVLRLMTDVVKSRALDKDVQETAGNNVYWRLVGEVEARNTQRRQQLDDAQRLATPPSATQDVADAEQIVVRGDRVVSRRSRATVSDAAAVEQQHETEADDGADSPPRG